MRQQQKVKKNAHSSGKNSSQLLLQRHRDQPTTDISKKLLIRYFFFPLEQQGHDVHILQGQKKKGKNTAGTLQLERDDRKGINGDSKDSPLKQQRETGLLSHDAMAQRGDGWKCVMVLFIRIWLQNTPVAC